ncbi:proteasome activator complex subunit-like protein [Leptotrombidium deliense]|uniref:Proteasome activator complex subunit-like protein n=1 Tax=Leptotrombidium deliense TaxID=299467 RepID=A0A443SMG9_9ACAR|nr:proteasome activator complex subunit-like protein [Leptotrombidium deliense]
MDSTDDEASAISTDSCSEGCSATFADQFNCNEENMEEVRSEPDSEHQNVQQELVYNKHLPYYASLKDEALNLFKTIKGNLTRSILLSEAHSMNWIENLVKYVKLYGRHFSKNDHIYLVNLFLEVVIVPGLDPRKVHWFIVVLYDLLKKHELLSPDDLVIQWRPLYDLYTNMFYNSKETYGLHIVPDNFEFTFKLFLRKARLYFPLTATREILDELKPLLCVYNNYSISKATTLLNLFLPTLLKPEDHDNGFKLWFDDLLALWDTSQNNTQWETSLICLFSQLAKDNIGYINWDPYIPKIFTHLLRSYNLVGGARKVEIHRSFNISASCTWIISMLGGPSTLAMDHVAKLFTTLESYYHPSNNGKWNSKLSKFLASLPYELINRLHVERYKKHHWEPQIPNDYKLTEQHITQFVNILKPIILIHMFSRFGEREAAFAWNLLSTVRPEIVIPPLIEKLYSSLETVTEPHRLISSLQCAFAVSRNMISTNKYYPEGKTHVIPLLFQALPGLDPNDIKKCMITFQFISTYVALVPIIDCSSQADKDGLSETEVNLCLATAQWEDFVFQFIDRCFALIDNSANEHKPERREAEGLRLNEDGMTELGLTSTLNSILNQCSPEIYESALDKVFDYLSNRILEAKVAGKYAADMCRSFAKVFPDKALKKFVPHFSKLVLALSSSDEVLEEDILDQHLVFSLLILSEVVRCNGKYLLEYRDTLVKVLDRSLKMKSRNGYMYGCALLRNALKALTAVYPLDMKSFSESWEEMSDFSKTSPIQYWGKSGDLKNLNMKWHIPSHDEVEFAQQLLDDILLPKLIELNDMANAASPPLSKDDLQKYLNIVLDSITGVISSLPMWNGVNVQLPESCDPDLDNLRSTVPLSDYAIIVKETGMKPLNFISGDNIRETVAKSMRNVCSYIQANHEDDTKSLLLVIKIVHTVLFSWGVSGGDFDTRWKSFQMVKKAMENRLQKKKRHIRVLLIDRVVLQHELRLKNKVKSPFTELHRDLLQDILSLSISHYSGVRTKAQESLFTFFKHYCFAHLLVVPKLLEVLDKNSDASHEELKGALHILLGKKEIAMVSVPDWGLLNKVWLALVNGKYSEKPSIITLMTKINDTLHKNADGIWVFHAISDKCKDLALKAWNEGIKPIGDCPSAEQIQQSTSMCEQRNKLNCELYKKIVHGLSQAVDEGKLHWRYNHLAFSILCMIIRGDINFPKEGVNTVVKNSISENINVRKLSIVAIAAILKQQKSVHPKRKFKPNEENLTGSNWLQFDCDKDYLRESVWKSTVFVEKNYYGFYEWPQSGINIYDTHLTKDFSQRTRSDLREEETPIYDFFMRNENIEKLMSFLSLEERKGQDKFSSKKFQMFKGLFRNFGIGLLSKFKDKVTEFTSDSHESCQRCAAEVIAGLVRGSKHLCLSDTIEMKNFLEPLILKMLDNMTTETYRDWGTCIATSFSNRDGRKLCWFVKLLVTDPLNSNNSNVSTEVTTSFLQSSRIYCLLGIIQQQSWRGLNILHNLLEYLVEKDHLTHSYENVRERIGFLLSTIFLYDTNVPCMPNTIDSAPKRKQLIEKILPKFDVLMNATKNGESHQSSEQRNGFIHKSPEEKEASNLLKTMCRWILSNFTECPISIPPEFYRFLPVVSITSISSLYWNLCEVQSDTKDEEVLRESLVAIILLSHALVKPETLRVAVDTCIEISTSNSWHARSALAKFLQYMVSSNLFTIMSDMKLVHDIKSLVLTLLEDERIEVREKAAQALGDLIHCEFIKVNDSLVDLFRQKCKITIRKSRSACDMLTTYNSADVAVRHAGVLGFCSIVNAYPYDVPDFLPTILMLLAVHLNDPQPINETVKKTLCNFRRTHHDNWRDHKLKFSDDQLAIITDLLVSPTYYA